MLVASQVLKNALPVADSFANKEMRTSSRIRAHQPIGVQEGILLGGRKKFALKITICPKNRQLALKLTF